MFLLDNTVKFLVVDTAGPSVGAALSDGSFFRDDDNRNASAVLMPAVDKLLSDAKLSLSELDFVACVVGPGSFTGIRIGVSAVRALCYATGKQAVGIHYLRMLAYNKRADGYGKILCISDGSNNTAYIAEYDANRREILPCRCVAQESAIAMAKAYDGAVCTDERMAAFLPEAFAPEKDCGALVRAAFASADERVAYSLLLPVYIRESQAERDWKAREQNACIP